MEAKDGSMSNGCANCPETAVCPPLTLPGEEGPCMNGYKLMHCSNVVPVVPSCFWLPAGPGDTFDPADSPVEPSHLAWKVCGSCSECANPLCEGAGVACEAGVASGTVERKRCVVCDHERATAADWADEANHPAGCECERCQSLCWSADDDGGDCWHEPVNWRERALGAERVLAALERMGNSGRSVGKGVGGSWGHTIPGIPQYIHDCIHPTARAAIEAWDKANPEEGR